MNEIKLSTIVNEQTSRLAIKMNVAALGVDWDADSIIRVISNKDNNTLILKKVGKKASKTIAHKLTSTGGGTTPHSLGLYMSYTNRRFKAPLQKTAIVSAAVRFLDEEKQILQVYMPEEIFSQE